MWIRAGLWGITGCVTFAIDTNVDIENMLPKFVITTERLGAGGCSSGVCHFRLGMVNQHKDLLRYGDACLGGGYYRFDYTSNRIVLDRFSYDFGFPKWHLIEVLRVPSAYRGMRMVYYYDDGREFDVSSQLRIEYCN